MAANSWMSQYHAAILEADPIEFPKRIVLARQAIHERLSELPEITLTSEQREEFHQLCDARRILELLEKTALKSAKAS